MTKDSRESGVMLPSVGPVRTGCLCCAPKPEVAPLDWQPHPGFGRLDLTRDGDAPEWWDEFCSVVRWVYCIDQGWRTTTIARGPRAGEPSEWFDGDWFPDWACEHVTLAEIEECVAEDPDHDWRLTIEGPLGGVVYQRQGCAQWVAVERLDGFA